MKLQYQYSDGRGRVKAPSLSVRLVRPLAIALFVLGGCLEASAANHYVRAGAAGGAKDGSSWANAWTSFGSAQWTRGDTYFVAGGTYSENVVVAKALSGTQWITVKKANAADNSKDANWSASYATDQTVINGTVKLSNGYIEFDGVTGSGTGGHGIKIYNAVDTHVLAMDSSTGPYHVFHCEVKGRTRLSEKGFDGLYNNNASPQKGLHIGNCWIHDCGRNGITIGSIVGTSYEDYGMLFENNVIEETGGSLDGGHAQAMQISYEAEDSYLIIRNNIYINNIGSAAISYLGGKNAKHKFNRIYNNIFIIIDQSKYGYSPGVIWAHANAAACDHIEIYNNTFYGVKLGQCALDTAGGSDNILENNVWENCFFSGKHRGFSEQSNNGYFGNTGAGVPKESKNQVNGSATTFVNAGAGDFSLVPDGYAVGAGMRLTNVFTTDFTGNTRGAKWDMGARASAGRTSSAASTTGTPPPASSQPASTGTSRP